MNTIAGIITGLTNALLFPVGQSSTWGLIWLSLLAGVLMAFVFKLTSNPKRIKAAKDKVKARILEMRIYQDDPGLIIKAFGGTMLSNGRYLSALIVPFLVLIGPISIIWMQLDERYSRSHLAIGAQTILSVQLKEGFDPYTTPVTLTINDPGLSKDSRPVRVRATREVDWRLRVHNWGEYYATITAEGVSYTFPVVAREDTRMIGHKREASSFIEPLLHPALGAIPVDSPFNRVSLEYPSATYSFLMWKIPWWGIFLIYSALSAIILKFVIGFEI